MAKSSPLGRWLVFLALIWLGAIITAGAQAEQLPVVTGEHWVTSTEGEKKAFLIGMGTIIEVEQEAQSQSPTPLPDEAVRGYTAGSARMLGKFDELGTITEGKKADLVILSDNLFDIDVEDIPNTTVLLTMMDGKITYAEPYAASAAALDDPKIKYSWQE